MTLKQYFKKHHYLSINGVAKIARINPSLLRQYVCGVKTPSDRQIEKINIAIQLIVGKLLNTSI